MHSSAKRAAEKYKPGARFANKYGEWFTVIEYLDFNNVEIIFDIDSNSRVVKSKDILRSSLRGYNSKTIVGVACFGYGPYVGYNSDGSRTSAYNCYYKMIDRCYNENSRCKNPTYADCTVSDEWLNYQNFAEWYYRQPGTDLPNFQLDKDLTRSRVYGEEFCYFIPKEINCTIRQVLVEKQLQLPRGVASSGLKSTPYVCTYKDKKSGSLTYFQTVEEARHHYLVKTKEKLLRVAKSYGNSIHKDVLELLEKFDWESL